MKSFNFKMITLAREVRGLTQEQLSDMLPNLHQGNLSKIEKGLLGVSDSTLQSIADALRFPVNFFYQDDVRPALSNLYYRKQYKINGKTLRSLRAAIIVLTRAIGNIMDEVEMERPFEKLRFDFKDGWTPERAALATREILGIPHGPIHNPIEWIEKAGIIVFYLNFDLDGFDGVAAITDGGWPIIFVNKYKSNDRTIMNIAHELCHLCMHIPFVVEPFRDEEAEARTYASEFLMPSKEVKADLIGLSYNKLAELKAYWRVSKASLVVKANNLGTITKGTYAHLMAELGRRGERKVEEGYIELDTPTLLKKIVGLYRERLGYSIEDMAALSNLRTEDYVKHFSFGDNEPKIKRLISVV